MAGDRRRQRDYDGDYFVDGGLLFSVSSLAASNIVPAAASHGWAKCQKPTRNEIKKKIVKFTRCTYACNSFTNFEYQDHSMTGNGSYVNLL